MKTLNLTLGVLACCVMSAGVTAGSSQATVKAAAAPAAQPEAIWQQYSNVFAGSRRAQEMAEPLAQVMTNHTPLVLLRLSPVQRPGRSMAGGLTQLRVSQGSAAMGVYLVQVLRHAYHLAPEFPQNRILIPEGQATTRYDYIDTLAQGGPEVLQRALREQFGLVARRELRQNLVLTVKGAGAGLHKHTETEADSAAGFRSQNITLEQVANRLSRLLGVEVRDQTQLAGGYDFTLNVPPGATTEQMAAAILDQLGLQLTPAQDGQQVEFLIVDKAK